MLSLQSLQTSFSNKHDAIIEYLDFPMIYDDYMFLLNNIPERGPYLYGESYAKIFFWLVPRRFWPQKPVSIDVLYARQFFPNLMLSRPTLMVGELYWNFSWIGVIVGMYVVGYLIKILDIVFHTSLKKNDYMRILIICLILSYSIDFFRGGWSTNLISMFLGIFCLPLLLTFSASMIKHTNFKGSL
jgi:oligosaccharide repeat unit polymerase